MGLQSLACSPELTVLIPSWLVFLSHCFSECQRHAVAELHLLLWGLRHVLTALPAASQPPRAPGVPTQPLESQPLGWKRAPRSPSPTPLCPLTTSLSATSLWIWSTIWSAQQPPGQPLPLHHHSFGEGISPNAQPDHPLQCEATPVTWEQRLTPPCSSLLSGAVGSSEFSLSLLFFLVIIESSKLKKNSKTIRSNRQPIPTMPT